MVSKSTQANRFDEMIIAPVAPTLVMNHCDLALFSARKSIVLRAGMYTCPFRQQ